MSVYDWDIKVTCDWIIDNIYQRNIDIIMECDALFINSNFFTLGINMKFKINILFLILLTKIMTFIFNLEELIQTKVLCQFDKESL